MGNHEDSRMETALRAWSRVGIALGIVFTVLGFVGYWREMRQAEQDDGWVVHSHAVRAALGAAFAHCVDMESGSRGFAATGDEVFLDSFEQGQHAIGANLDELQALTKDDPVQQERVTVFRSQIDARAESARRTIDERRRVGMTPAPEFLLEGKRRMDAVRATIQAIQGEEDILLERRRAKATATRQKAERTILVSMLAGVTLLILAGSVTGREINRSAKMRADIQALNASLERRVEERTAQSWENQQRLQRVIESAMDGIITVDQSFRIVLFNAAAVKIFRCSVAEALGQSLDRFIPQRFHAAHAVHLREFGESGTTNRGMGSLIAVSGLRADGEEFQMEASISQCESAGKKNFTVILRDITERKRAEEALHQSSIRTRFALDTAKLGDWELNLKTLQASRSLLHDQIFGYPSLLPEWSFDIFLSHVHPDDRERIRQNFMTCVSQGRRWEFECRISRANGECGWIWACGDTYQDSPPRMYGIVKDITERKLVEEALRESEQTVRSLLDSTAEAILGDDLEGNCTFCNPAALRLLGYNHPEELLGKSLHAVMHHTLPDGRPLAIEDCQLHFAVRAGRDFHADDLLFWRKDGTSFPVECWSHPVFRGKTANGSVVTFIDIADRRRSQEQIQTLNNNLELRVRERTAQLEASNRELEAFTYSVSHDLRAPLRHISGFSKILCEEFGPHLPGDAQRHLQRIEEGTRRMGQLVDELLDLAQVGRREVSLQMVSLDSLVEDVIAGFESDVGDRKVEWKVAALPFVECDAVLMKQVFQNLLSNALKFTRRREQATIEIGQEQQNGAAVIFVRDNGVGFSMKYASKLFGVFQRLHRAEDFEGTGVGLATVERIVQKHGGRIWAEAELDKGASFYFTLNRADGGEAKVKAAVAGDKS